MRTLKLSSVQAKNNKSTTWEESEKFRKGWKTFDGICGLENPGQDKIIGGHEAAENEWPWQVEMGENVVFISDSLLACRLPFLWTTLGFVVDLLLLMTL